MTPKLTSKHPKKLGQYFTTHPLLQQKVFDWIYNRPDIILEPSVGRGDIVKYVESKGLTPKWELYEIDTTIDFLIDKNTIHFGNFLEYSLPKKSFKTIIGNPPYVKIKEHRNLYLEFIEKCVDLLCEDGELIFIVPSDFFTLTSAISLLEKMFNLGSFTDLFYPDNEHLFTNASIDVMVFRYQIMLGQKPSFCNYNGVLKKIEFSNKIVRVSEPNEITREQILSDKFDVFVGMVSGKDDVFCSEQFGNIDILKDQNHHEKFIFTEKFPTDSKNLDEYLLSHKSELMSRKIIKITEQNWFKWGAPRNINTIKTHMGEDCIYVKNLTRSEQIAFRGKVEFFSGNLLLLIPKTKNDNILLEQTHRYLNSSDFKKQHTFAGRFKITQRQLSMVLI